MANQTNTSTQNKAPNNQETPPEQIAYAHLLQYCSWAGIGILIVTFLIYMSSLITPFIPPNEIEEYWTMPVREFLVATNAPHGWGWVSMMNHGDYLSLLGIAFLGLLTIVGYLFLLLPAYVRRKNWTYAAIVLVEVIILLLAASGAIVLPAA